MSTPTIEILYFDGCPRYAVAAPMVRRVAASQGARVEHLAIASAEQAEHARFLGSPTVRVDGVDVDVGAEARDDYGLKCRLYRTPAGLRPVPPEAWVREAFRRARDRHGGLGG